MEFEIIKPTLKDISSMQKLVYQEIQNGIILDRDDNEMATTIRSYSCAVIDNQIVGFVALHIHTTILAEIRSLVVKSEFRNKGIGQKLIQYVLDEARALDVKEVLVLTYQTKLFQKFDFKEIEKSTIPEPKIWADCIKCKHFPICDEVSLVLTL